MKAKTMLGLIACASACVSLSAFGNETNGWFGVKVENAEIVHPNCATNGAAVTIDGSAIKLEDASLVIDHFAEAPTSDGIVKISATALLTPSSTSDFVVSGSPKAGFAVGIDGQNETNFYGYASNSWHKLTGATPGAGDTSFSMILNYRDKVVSFYVDDVLLTSEDPLILDADSLAAINASGSGSITSVTGAYEVAVAAYDGKKYGSGYPRYRLEWYAHFYSAGCKWALCVGVRCSWCSERCQGSVQARSDSWQQYNAPDCIGNRRWSRRYIQGLSRRQRKRDWFISV